MLKELCFALKVFVDVRNLIAFTLVFIVENVTGCIIYPVRLISLSVFLDLISFIY